MTLVDDLKAAKALIDSPEKWRQGIRPDVPLCAGEAMSEAITIHASDEMIVRKQAMVEALGFFDLDHLVAFNDKPDTTHADIMALFDRAIAAAEASAS
jgi:hypothetical protein